MPPLTNVKPPIENILATVLVPPTFYNKIAPMSQMVCCLLPRNSLGIFNE